MNTDSTTLYKLMILYMLSKVNFPLSNTQLSSFMLDKQYTDYFTFQETINSLVEDGFIRGYTHQSSTHYTLTKEGEDTIAFFYTKISTAIRDDIETYLFDNKYELKNEAGTVTDCYKLSNGNYIAHCQLKEGDTTLIELNLNVPVEEQAEIICEDGVRTVRKYMIILFVNLCKKRFDRQMRFPQVYLSKRFFIYYL